MASPVRLYALNLGCLLITHTLAVEKENSSEETNSKRRQMVRELIDRLPSVLIDSEKVTCLELFLLHRIPYHYCKFFFTLDPDPGASRLTMAHVHHRLVADKFDRPSKRRGGKHL